MDFNEAALKLHRDYHGKIEINSKVPLKTADDLSTAYTPGVAQPCREIYKDPEKVYEYTAKQNLIAVVTDGTAVLGLGDIGPKAAMPVMEGKAALFKQFGHVDAVPICLDTKDPEEIIRTVKYIAPTFGGINLEDIASPNCFEIEKRLEEELDIPVFHDDQHGTAVVVTAALLNALKLVNKKIEEVKIALSGPGAAGSAIIRMLVNAGAKYIVASDIFGIVYKDREEGMDDNLRALCDITNPENIKGNLADAVKDADVFIGVSRGGLLTTEMVKTMHSDAIVFAMANPVPEITYEKAKAAGVRVMGTGRSDYPNQINNVLAFPGIFRGALDAGAKDINYSMKLAAARALADLVEPERLSEEYVIPSAFDPRVAKAVAENVAKAARESGACR
ncbi:malate dehydrogenase [Pseudocoprococcus immobilis]